MNDRGEGERVLDAAGENGGASCLGRPCGALVRTAPGGRRAFRPLLRCQAGNFLRNLCVPSGTSRRSPSGCSSACGSWSRSVRFPRPSAASPSRAPGGSSTPAPASSRRRRPAAPSGCSRSSAGATSSWPPPSRPFARRRRRAPRSSATAAAVAEADAAREAAESALRSALREAAEAEEIVSRSEWLIARRREAPDDGPEAVRRAELLGDLRAEQRLAERIEREREERARALAALRTGAERDLALAGRRRARRRGPRERARRRRGAPRRARRRSSRPAPPPARRPPPR